MSAALEPVIRPAVLAEVAAIVDLWIDFQRDHNARFIRSVRLIKSNRARMAKHLSELIAHAQVLVLARGAEVLGFAAIVVNPQKIDLFYASASISDLYVTPAARGQGWGRRLLNAAVETVRARGLHAVSISFMAGNREARSLYTSAGFRPQTETLLLPLDDEFVRFGKEMS